MSGMVPQPPPPQQPPMGPGPVETAQPFIVWAAHPILVVALAELFRQDPQANLRQVANGAGGLPERIVVDLPPSHVEELRRLLGDNVRIDPDTTFQLF